MNKLFCQGYHVDRHIGEPVRIEARFILPINPKESKKIADALRHLELLLSDGNGIDLVRSDVLPRCSFCGVLHEENETLCPQCGASL